MNYICGCLTSELLSFMLYCMIDVVCMWLYEIELANLGFVFFFCGEFRICGCGGSEMTKRARPHAPEHRKSGMKKWENPLPLDISLWKVY